MKHLFTIFFISISITGCSSLDNLDETEKLFSGTFSCPKTDHMPAWVEPVSMRKMSGVYVMVSDVSDRIESARGPQDYLAAVLDGAWRPYKLNLKDKTVIGMEKSELLDKNQIQFTYKYPDYTNSKNEKVKAGVSKRVIKINKEGNWVRYAGKSDSPICIRQ